MPNKADLSLISTNDKLLVSLWVQFKFYLILFMTTKTQNNMHQAKTNQYDQSLHCVLNAYLSLPKMVIKDRSDWLEDLALRL